MTVVEPAINTEALPFATDQPRPPLIDRISARWQGKLALLALSAALASAAFAPLGQFYLAWIAWVPWLLVIRATPSVKSAYFWGGAGAFLFFMPNLAYLVPITVPGAIALCMYLALFWGLAAAVMRGLGWHHVGANPRARPSSDDAEDGHRGPPLQQEASPALKGDASVAPTAAPRTRLLRAPLALVLAIALVWVSAEWLRGTLLTGLPFLYSGHTQSPLLVMCQIADLAGVYGISFWVMLINATVALTLIDLSHWRRMSLTIAATSALLLLIAGYGALRIRQAATHPGPHVLLVQPNFPFIRGDTTPPDKQQQRQFDFHVEKTREAIAKQRFDLIVWSETTMPPLNQEARHELRNSAEGRFPLKVHNALSALARIANTGVLAGGYYVGDWRQFDDVRRGTDFRNAAYFYDRTGEQTARYDKIHLVPFGEFIPFRISLPWLFQAFMWLSPYEEEYTLTAARGAESLTVFELSSASGDSGAGSSRPWRFVTPICFEDLDAPLVARMFRPRDGGGKRADFIVNLTNDGWFRYNEQAQHLQAALFRSIENRAPTARSVNTGISGFVDSIGRLHNLLPVRQEGVTVARIALDDRVTFYTRFGDVFAVTCTLLTAGTVIIARVRRSRLRAK